MNRYDSVKSAVLLNGQSKEVNGQQYHLVTIYFTPLFELQARDDAYTGWLVNGRRLSEVALKDRATTHPFTSLANGLMTVWLPMDETDRIEILYGVVSLSDAGDAVKDPASLRSELLKHFIPFSAEKLPRVEVDDRSSLLETFTKVGYPRSGPHVFSVASVNGLKKNIDGKQYSLLAIHFDQMLSLQINNSHFLKFNIWNELGTCDFQSVNGELDFKGTCPSGLMFVWVDVDKDRDSKLIFRYQLVDGNRIDNQKDRNEQIEKLMSESPGFEVDLKKLPEVNGKTYSELATQMLDLLPAQFPNPTSLSAKTADDADQIYLVDWIPLYSETEDSEIGSVLTLRFPIPNGLAWNTGGPEPVQGGPTPGQRWQSGLAKISIGGTSLTAYGRRPLFVDGDGGLSLDAPAFPVWAGKPYTHFEASFVVPKSIHLVDAEIKHLGKTRSFSRQQLELKQAALRCSYDLKQIGDAKRDKKVSTLLSIETNKPIFIERVKCENTEVNLLPYGIPRGASFSGVVDKPWPKQDKKILIKVRGLKDWLPFEYQKPFAQIKAIKAATQKNKQ